MERKFFHPNLPEIPVILQLLDCPNLHTFMGDGDQLLIALLASDVSIFSFRSVQAIIEYKWEIAYPEIIKKLLMPFVGYLICFQLYLESLYHRDDVRMNKGVVIYRYTTQALILLFAIYFLCHHVR